ncbi:MAG: LEA type 2 family protein [Bacteroidia bacterium]|nr:LEA type 2 family protein [Bacteroidia bacterium]
MKKVIKRIGIFLLILMIVAVALLFIFKKKVIAHFMPDVEQTGDIQIRIKNDTSYVSSKLIVKNKTFLKIQVDTIRYKISLFGKAYLKNEEFLGMVLPAYGNDTLDFSLKIPYKRIIKDMKAERKKGDSAAYSINVSLQYVTPFGKAEFPLNKKAKLKIPQPPDLKVEEIKWKKVRLKYLLADAQIRIVNYNDFSLTIKDLSYLMKISDQGNLKGKYKESITIKPKGTTLITLPIEIKVANFGKTVFEILFNKDKYNYTLTLDATLESTDSLKQSFHIDLVTSGKMELKK